MSQSERINSSAAAQTLSADSELSIDDLINNNISLEERSKSSEVFKLPPLRTKSSQNKCITKADLMFCPISKFGKDGPKISIGQAVYKPKYVHSEFPGPGQYNMSSSRSVGYSITRADPRTYIKCDTANVSIQDLRVFPQIKGIKMGNRTGRSFLDTEQTPAPSFMPPSTLAQSSHKISSRHEMAPPNIPGPGQYNPLTLKLENSPSYSIPNYNVRDEWLTDKDEMPGPGAYNPTMNSILPNRQSHSIGDKSSRCENRKQFIPFGSFIFALPRDISLKEAEQYMKEHPEFKSFVKEILDMVLKEKFDKPLDVIRGKFAEERRNIEKIKFHNSTLLLNDFDTILAAI